ncbi:MAG: hypothetical protein ACYTG2_10125 [Planctomycetota bacterium]|jgi:probable HAF family extracellular repeat protein
MNLDRWTGTVRVALACLCAAPTGLAQDATFRGLGFLPGGSAVSWPQDVSADGSTVVGASKSAGTGSDMEAFVWTEGSGMIGLGDLDGGVVSSSAQAVSADGTVVVGSTGSGQAFRWTDASGMVALADPLGVLVGGAAHGVSADGSVIVGVARSLTENQAFRWTQALGMVGLGWLPSDPLDSFAFDVSADGSVACGISFSGDFTFDVEPIVWTPRAGMVGLGDVPGGAFYAIAWGVSADGTTVVGEARLGPEVPGTDEAFLSTAAGGFVFMDPAHGAVAGSTAKAATADGSRVVGSGPGGAMLWDTAHGMRNLQDMLTLDFGLDLGGWTLLQATSVSDDGSVLVGYGLDPQGATQAWIVTLPVFFVDLGQALAGTLGDPLLTGTGTLVAGDALTLSLTNALANTTAWLVVGFAELNVPFKGGVMVPDFDAPGFFLPLPTGPSGGIVIDETWPMGVPPALTTYFQYWIQDPAGPLGFSASNAVSGTTP